MPRSTGLRHENQASSASWDVIGGFLAGVPTSRSENRLSISTLNVAKISELKMDMVLQLMARDDIDVMVLTDTQHSDTQARILSKRTRTFLGA